MRLKKGYFIVDDILWVRQDPRDATKLQWLTRWLGYGPAHDTLQSTESLLYCTVWRRYCDTIGFPWRRLVALHEASAENTDRTSAEADSGCLKASTPSLDILCVAAQVAAALDKQCSMQ